MLFLKVGPSLIETVTFKHFQIAHDDRLTPILWDKGQLEFNGPNHRAVPIFETIGSQDSFRSDSTWGPIRFMVSPWVGMTLNFMSNRIFKVKENLLINED